ncbi:PDZ domain-containing protein [Algoriphagus jejuensis]|uniref:PDZ domain-containing protein n=1 Tax=Algoriphagus jejuensis TaxID=419934 RepID=A0ABN1MY93_9BACT
MIYYHFSCQNPASQLIQIRLNLFNSGEKPISIQLPAWRAGRYQLANFAQNIRGFRVFDEKKREIPFQKMTKDRWKILSNTSQTIQIEYEYWAGKMDAGSAWVDDEQVYVNLVNCCFEVLDRSEEEIEVMLDLPNFPAQVSTLIPVSSSIWKAENFQTLADSTILAAKDLIHWEYRENETAFHIWIHGEVYFDKDLLLDRFKGFSRKLIQDFGEFPESEYHFIFQLLPYPHYHGVEHRRGTVITFGPSEMLREPDQIEELLGVSCHELYHTWNVCRIRPKELLPYNFSKETYTGCGLILEGVTTYMGDLYLLKSGVYDLPTYLRHLEKIVNREASSFGWKNYTIQESSFDLWLDGYVPGIPDRKVNIYSRGALLALSIDVLLLKNGSALARVMQKMWTDFGKPFKGYDLEDFENVVFEQFSDQTEIRAFFANFVHGYQDLFPKLKSLLAEMEIALETTFGEDWLVHQLGIRTNADGLIMQLHPDSKAFSTLMKNDRIVDWPVEKSGVSECLPLHIERNGRVLELTLDIENSDFFPNYRLASKNSSTLLEKWKG